MFGAVYQLDGAVENMGGHVLRQIKQGLDLVAQHRIQQMLILRFAGREVVDQLLRSDLHALRDLGLVEKLAAQDRLQFREAFETERLRRPHHGRRINPDGARDLGDGQMNDVDAAFQQKFGDFLLAGREGFVVAADPADDIVARFICVHDFNPKDLCSSISSRNRGAE